MRLDHDLHVSRKHARLFVKDGDVLVEDLGSRGGVFVNHARIEAPWPLSLGDAIKIGDTVLTLELEATMVDDDGEFVGTMDASLPARRFNQPADADGITMMMSPEDFAEANIKERKEVKIENQFDAWNRSMFFCDRPDEDMIGRLKVLYELPLQFAVEEEADCLFKLILKRSIELIPGATRGLLLSYEVKTGKLAMRYCIPERAELAVSRTLVKQAASQGASLIWSWKDPADDNLQTGIYAPLIWHETVRGMLYVDSPGCDKPFGEEETRFLQAIAHYAAMAIGMRNW